MILQERNSELSSTNNFSAQTNETDILLTTCSRNFLFSRLLLAKERITLIIVTKKELKAKLIFRPMKDF